MRSLTYDDDAPRQRLTLTLSGTSARFQHLPIEPDVRFSLIRLSDGLYASGIHGDTIAVMRPASR